MDLSFGSVFGTPVVGAPAIGTPTSPLATKTSAAWNVLVNAYGTLAAAIRGKKPTTSAWQFYTLACQSLADALWEEEKALAQAPAPAPTPAPTPVPGTSVPFDPRIRTWVDSDGATRFDFVSCPFKVGNP